MAEIVHERSAQGRARTPSKNDGRQPAKQAQKSKPRASSEKRAEGDSSGEGASTHPSDTKVSRQKKKKNPAQKAKLFKGKLQTGKRFLSDSEQSNEGENFRKNLNKRAKEELEKKNNAESIFYSLAYYAIKEENNTESYVSSQQDEE